jgi:hypothetical protein
MKKLLFASVCLISTPALAVPNPVTCYTWVATPQYAAEHPKEKITALRIGTRDQVLQFVGVTPGKNPLVSNPIAEAHQSRILALWIDVMVRGSKYALSNRGECEASKDHTSFKCSFEPDTSGTSGGSVILKPGRNPEVSIGNPVRAKDKYALRLDDAPHTIKLQRMADTWKWCERDVGKALEGLAKVWGGGEPK